MSLVRDKRKTYTFKVKSKNLENFRHLGDEYELDASKSSLKHEYRDAAMEYHNASKLYKKSLDNLDANDSSRKELEKLYSHAVQESRKNRRMAALYKITEDRNPIIRGLIRRIKGRHILTSFILALFFSFPNLTGNVVGVSVNGVSSLIGVVFFLLGILLSYFYVFGRILINKMIEK